MLGQTGSEGSTGLRSLAICREYRRRRLRKRKKVRHSRLNWRFPEDHPWFCGLGWLFFLLVSFVFCFFFLFDFAFWNATAYFAQFAIRGYAPDLVQSSGVLTAENRSNIRVGKVWEVQWKCESVFCVVLAQLAVRKYWAPCWLVDTLLLIWSVVQNVICFWECVSWFQWRSRCRKTTCACVSLCQSWTWSAYCVIITMEVREAHFSLCSFFNPVNRRFSNAEKSC